MTASNPPSPRIVLRDLRADDLSLLVEWINSPHVQPWWQEEVDFASVEKRYGPRMAPDSPTHVFIAEADSAAIGMIQCYRHADYPDWNRTIGIDAAAGIDYLIGPADFLGKGYGVEMINAVVEIVFQRFRDVELVVCSTNQNNRRSCRALEKAGFEFLEERELDSDDPSDRGLSRIYVRKPAIMPAASGS